MRLGSMANVVAGVAAWLCVCGHAQPAEVHVVTPHNHSWLLASPETGTLPQLEVIFGVKHFHIPHDGFVQFSGDKMGAYRHEHEIPSVIMSGIEPGSYFWTLQLVHRNGTLVQGPATRAFVHIEVVLPLESKPGPAQASVNGRLVLFNLPHKQRPRIEKQRGKVCFVSSMSAMFDGQKKMWLQQIQAFANSRSTAATMEDVKFSVLTFERVTHESVLARTLEELDVNVTGVPLEMSRKHFHPSMRNGEDMLEYLVESIKLSLGPNQALWSLELASTALPGFVVDFWRRIVDALTTCKNGVLVLANSRNIGDEALVIGARLAKVKAIVMELANLEPVNVEVDVIIAPSHFALHHPSVLNAARASKQFVLRAGIDHNVFYPGLRVYNATGKIVVGYVGRLATEKSLGILLSAAKLLRGSCHNCRVRIIGDGPLEDQLVALADDFAIMDMVEFVRGVYDEVALVQELHKMDVFVCTRFLETLGIAALEAMGTGLPIVGFFSGGTTEFLHDGYNGIAVKEPSAGAFHDAIKALVQDPALRQYLGMNARRTVELWFRQDQQLPNYGKLYKRLLY